MATAVVSQVNSAYSNVARNGMDRGYAEKVANAFGYSSEELQSVPADSNLGLSCGNPLATAHLQPGEHVIDLGSGGGLDCFLAASKVGKTGQVVGLDMSEDMLALARRNAARLGHSPPQVAFERAELGVPLPVQTGSVDCILSNCVLNLVESPRKAAVLVELFRVLRPGGRLAIHDILSKGDMDESLKANMNLYIGCISGAVSDTRFEAMLKEAGFQDIVMIDSKSDLNVYFQDGGVGCCGAQNAPEPTTQSSCGPSASASCCKPAAAPTSAIDLNTFDANKHASSFSIYAVKPGTKPETPLPDILAR